jgi:hypothetical protein
MASTSRAMVALFLFCGCASSVSGWHQSTRELCSNASCFRLGTLDPSWTEVHHEKGEVGFFNTRVGGVIQTNTACRDDADAAPLTALTNRLLIGYTERRDLSSELVDLDGREALHSVIEAKLDGVPVTLDLYVMKRDGCIFDLSFAAPVARSSEGKVDFDRFIRGFALARTN